MIKHFAVAATLAVLASSSFAADRGYVYGGADFGTTKIKDLSGRSSSFGSFVGFQATEMFGAEVNVRRLADTTDNFVDTRLSQIGVSAIATMPLVNGINVYGRLGYNHLKIVSDGASDTESKVLYGVGLSYAFTPVISGRVELQKPHSDVSNISAGVVFKF
ncbi:MAG: outer membrane beta-barrel protein [Massilia sp.]